MPFALVNLKASVRPHARETTLGDFPRPGWRGTWTPDCVQIRDPEGGLRDERRDPRRHFRGLVNQVYWDKLDILYFAGYALWNYLSFPFLLEEPGVVVTENDASSASPRLDAVFDASFPTHSARQSFWLDPSRRLVRHDYTADVIGTWATAAHFCEGGVEVRGFASIIAARFCRASDRATPSCASPRWCGSRSTMCASSLQARQRATDEDFRRIV